MDQVMHRPIAIFIATLLIASLLIVGNPATQPTTEPILSRSFTSNEFNFHLDYPDDWTVLDHPANNQVFSMQTEPAKSADKNLGVMGLRIDTAAATGKDAEILKDISGAMVDVLFNHGAKNIVIKPDQLGDIPARRIRCSTDQSTGNTTAIYIVAVHARITYVFTIAAPSDQIETMLPKVDAVVKSFKILE